MVVSGAVDNSNYAANKTINVSTQELTYTGNDSEVAAVVANELGHIISGHASKGKLVNFLLPIQMRQQMRQLQISYLI